MELILLSLSAGWKGLGVVNVYIGMVKGSDKEAHKMPREAPLAAADEALRRRVKEVRYKKWLEQVTINAVDQALRFQLEESQRQPGVGEDLQELQGCSSSNSASCSEHPNCNGKNWILDQNSEERRIVAARIYSLLVQWKPDMSFEWRARVAAAVHIFESALYREAKSKEEYMNSLMLDLQLRQILRQFEAGTGPSLLSKDRYNGPLRKCMSFDSASMERRRRPLAVSALMTIREETRRFLPGTENEIDVIDRDATHIVEQARDDETSTVQREHLLREKADSSLWEAILSGNLKDMEETLSRYREYASKRVIKRVTGILFKRKRDEEKKIELELHKAMLGSNAEELATTLIRARAEFGDKLKEVCNDAEIVLERLIEVKEDSRGPPVSMPPGRGPESRRGREIAEPGSTAQTLRESITMPQVPLRQSSSSGFRRTVTFCSREKTQTSSHLRNDEGNYRRADRSHESSQRVEDDDAGTASASASEHDNSSELSFSFGQVTAQASYGQGATLCRPLGSLLGWLPGGRAASSAADNQIATVIPSASRQGDQRARTTSISESQITELDESRFNQQIDSTESASDVVVDTVTSFSPNDSDVPRISLMALLHQDADPETVFVLNRRRLSLGIGLETSEMGDELSEEMIDGGMDPICCVCMVGKKGAAFIPCGHTFCRKCTRELRKGRGRCPLCNRKIHDVLKIY